MSARINRFAWPLAVALAWLWACIHLSGEWRTNEQYRFGFGIPFIAAWMAWRRRGGAVGPGAANLACRSVLALGLLALALGTLLHWHDPLWRLTGALLAAGAALLTGAWFYRIGGTPLLRRQVFPLCFSLLAVPWPVPVENWIILRLTGAVTAVATTLANLFGLAALQRGNTIELSRGIVGMEDACSGIQSLQAMLVAAIFLGEYFTLPVLRRASLVAGGAVLSVVTNCVRVVALTLVTGAHGGGKAAGWHDVIGGTATVIAFALLLAVAVAQYAERLGLRDDAAKAYRMLKGTNGAERVERAGWLGLILLAEQSGDTRKLRDQLREFVGRFPGEFEPQNDLAYLDLLLNENIAPSLESAAQRVKRFPDVLAYRTTLALAHLRNGDAAAARRVYGGIETDWSTAQPGWHAVYAAVLAASGEQALAGSHAREIHIARLKAEERVLIAGLGSLSTR